MTTKKILSICIFMSSILFACHNSDQPEPDPGNWMDIRLASMKMSRPTDAYNYPCQPGTPEWEKLTTSDEKHEACLIPNAIIPGQSTQGLIQDIWEYPLLPDFLLFSNSSGLQKAFAGGFIPQSNMYKELLTRKDLIECLAERYRLMDPSLDQEGITLVFEALLGMDDIITRMNMVEQKEIIGLALKKDQIRVKRNIDIVDRSITWYLIGRILQLADYEPFVFECTQNQMLSGFLKTSILVESEEIIERIALFGEEFIKK